MAGYKKLSINRPSGRCLPPGLYSGRSAACVLDGNHAFRGLVAAVVIDNYQVLKERGLWRPRDESDLAAALAAHRYIALEMTPGEYTVIFPQHEVESGKPVLELGERLWDFQLSRLGSFSIRFSQAGHHSHGESLGAAIEQARRRVIETRMGRSANSRGLLASVAGV